MNEQTSPEEIVKQLKKHSEVVEGYVLIRELSVFLEVGHDFYHPDVKIKIYLSTTSPTQPYTFDVSHYVHTPTQAGPYVTSRVNASTEEEAINMAISTTTSFLKDAIRADHEPDDDWLVENKNF